MEVWGSRRGAAKGGEQGEGRWRHGKSVAVVVKNSSPPLAPSHGKRVGTGTGAHKTGDRGKIVFSHAVGGFLQDRLVCHMTESDKNIRCTYKTGNP